MKKLIVLLVLLFPLPALGANCVAIVYHLPENAAPFDLRMATVPWSGVQRLRDNHNVVHIRLMYDNPLLNPVATGVNGHEAYGLAYIQRPTPEGKEGLTVSWYDQSPAKGRRTTYFESLAQNDPVTGTFGAAGDQDIALLAIMGTDMTLPGLPFGTANYDRIDAAAYDLADSAVCE